MTTPATHNGQLAEQRACDHLQQQGLRLLQKNYRCRLGEIDLVMQHGKHLVFVEVRSRRNNLFGGAAASVTAKKQEKLRLTALHYLQHHAPNASARFDVVAIQGAELEWIQDAF